jgi:hypothetical protein
MERKPFHESIVDAIHRAKAPTDLAALGQLIHESKIPKGHDEIAAAWIGKSGELGLNDDADVADSVMSQKPADMAEAA